MQTEDEFRRETIITIAKHMILAARTAPKGRGTNNLTAALITTPDDIKTLQNTMNEIAEQQNLAFFKRDSDNLNCADAIVILGSKIQPMGLGESCQMCGYLNCEKKPKTTPCVFNTGDLGIAIGSAVSVAANHHLDNRIMFSIGQAALKLKLLGSETKIAYGIPLSATSKNPFFDRK